MDSHSCRRLLEGIGPIKLQCPLKGHTISHVKVASTGLFTASIIMLWVSNGKKEAIHLFSPSMAYMCSIELMQHRECLCVRVCWLAVSSSGTRMIPGVLLDLLASTSWSAQLKYNSIKHSIYENTWQLASLGLPFETIYNYLWQGYLYNNILNNWILTQTWYIILLRVWRGSLGIIDNMSHQ